MDDGVRWGDGDEVRRRGVVVREGGVVEEKREE